MPEKKNSYILLYIEDDANTRQLVKRILPQKIFTIYEAESALDALEKLEHISPDIILMDLDLPDLTGLELSTKIKSHPQSRDTVIIAVTGKKEFSSKEKTIIAGCDSFIPKPFDIDSFSDQIIEVVQGKKEKLSPEQKDSLISEYQAELVNKLEEKVRLLQELNSQITQNYELLSQKELELRSQNEKLLKLNLISNKLHKIKTIDDFISSYPKLIVEHLGYKRCILFQIDLELNKIFPASWAGIKDEEVKDIHLQFKRSSVEKFVSETDLMFVTDLEEIKGKAVEEVFQPLFEKVKTRGFAVGYVGPQLEPRVLDRKVVMENDNINKMLNTLYDKISPENLHLELEKYLTGFLFKFTGVLYVDDGDAMLPVSDFDKQLLTILIETSKVVYENISLIQILQKLYLKAGQDAITDPLTGIYNYRFFINQLLREINRAQRYKIPVSLAMLDIDYFKHYNDNFGHLAGDFVLRTVTHILTENTRISDIVARYGGEEFVVILPEASKEEAFKLADKLRKMIEMHQFPNEEHMPNGNLTISIGVASFPEDATIPEKLIKAADTALYDAKNSGRNRVCMYKK
ncbi:MAG: hypothetical protein Kow00108_05900 [Calditrichia bacterium]